MKNQILPTGRKMTWALALSAVTTLGFVSCSSDDDDVVQPDASVKVIHTIPNGGSVNFFLDGTKQNASAIAFGEATGYLAVGKGQKTAEFKTATGDNTILTSPVNFEGGSYSLFATGTTGDNQVAAILVEDNLQTPAAGKARVRLAHVAPDAPSVNVLVNDSLLLSNAAYKNISGFVEVPARTYTVKLKNSGNGQTIYTRTDIVLEAGKNYTLAAQGLTSGTGAITAPFSVNVITY